MQFEGCHFKLRGQAIIASLLVGFVLLLNAMVAVPTLHELIHKDAGSADHQCAVTLFAHGQIDSVPVDIPVIITWVTVESAPPIPLFVLSTAIENLPAGRAPPVLPVVS